MANNKAFVMTDFGAITLTDKAFAYVGGDDGMAIILNKRRWGKEARHLRRKLKRLEDAVMVMAEIEFISGGLLERY